MKNNKNTNNLSSLNKIIYLFIILIVFSFTFVVLIKKQQSTNLADIAHGFNMQTKEGEVLVAKDMRAIYPKYYVIFFYDGIYEVHTFHYYNTVSQFDLRFNEMIDKIVDYNRKENMIRCYDLRGYGTYWDVKNNLAGILGVGDIKVYE